MNQSDLMEIAKIETYVSLRKLHDMAVKKITTTIALTVLQDRLQMLGYSICGIKPKSRINAKSLMDMYAKAERLPISKIF